MSKSSSDRRLFPLPAWGALAALVALALGIPAARAGTLVDLSVEASRAAPNDQVVAGVYAEAAGNSPAELAQQVNKQIAEGLRIVRGYPSVKAQTGSSHSYPVYGRGGKIESWRMRSELLLESRDLASLSELLGRLQSGLAVSRLALQATPETRKKAEDESLLDALAAFDARAKKVAQALGKTYRVKQLSISSGGRTPPIPMMRASAASEGMAAMPLEAGESLVSTSVSGQIELAD